eukprot:GILJ01005369.1.p1 GENE.GILJ01005369.1~~GILJ01005369.1.p1  ORF type:complete len:372 (+),score=46.16 GILJ01005369.1:43-1116(+)
MKAHPNKLLAQEEAKRETRLYQTRVKSAKSRLDTTNSVFQQKLASRDKPKVKNTASAVVAASRRLPRPASTQDLLSPFSRAVSVMSLNSPASRPQSVPVTKVEEQDVLKKQLEEANRKIQALHCALEQKEAEAALWKSEVSSWYMADSSSSPRSLVSDHKRRRESSVQTSVQTSVNFGASVPPSRVLRKQSSWKRDLSIQINVNESYPPPYVYYHDEETMQAEDSSLSPITSLPEESSPYKRYKREMQSPGYQVPTYSQFSSGSSASGQISMSHECTDPDVTRRGKAPTPELKRAISLERTESNKSNQVKWELKQEEHTDDKLGLQDSRRSTTSFLSDTLSSDPDNSYLDDFENGDE